MRKLFSFRSSLLFALGIFALGFFVFFGLVGVKPAMADNGGIIVNVKQELVANLVSATVDISCTGGSLTNLGTTDASGNVTVLLASVPAGANCANSESIDIRIVKDGYVGQTFVAFGTYLTGSQNTYNVTGIQFSHKFVVKDELNAALTPTSATAGASLVACSVLTNNLYCPIVLADDNTSSNGAVIIKDGYVTTTASDVPLASNRTAGTDAQGVTTMTGTNGLDFAHKFIVVQELGTALTPTSATAGTSLVACTVSTNNVYCPVVLADDDTLANGAVIIKDGYVTTTAADVPLASNRAAGTTAQGVTTMTTTNGLDFAYKITAISSETLLTALGATVTTLEVGDATGRNACSLSGGSWYCPVVLANSNGTLISRVIQDGYVEKLTYALTTGTTRVANTDAQRSDTIVSIEYGVKVTVTQQTAGTAITGATVTDSAGTVTCVENGVTGIYFCVVPLADTQRVVAVSKSGYLSDSAPHTDRTAHTDAQEALTFALVPVGSGSVGGGGSPVSTQNTTETTATETTITETTVTETLNIVDRIRAERDVVFSQTNAESYFINTGTESTLGLGSGERAAAVSSFKEAFGFAPTTAAHWEDVLNIANGRWPYGIVKTMEARAYLNFNAIYGRNADMKNSTDVNALKMMGYGVRSTMARDLNKERTAIGRFRSLFGYLPSTAFHWNIMRAIAYSGVVK